MMSIQVAARTTALAILIALQSGCLDFEDVTRPVQSGTPAMISLSGSSGGRAINFTGGAGRVRVEARVLPGVDAQGPRQLLVDTLHIGTLPVVPWMEMDGIWYYSAEWRGEEDAEVLFRLPRIGRVGDSPSLVSWQPVRSADPDTVRLIKGGDLVLRMSSSRPSQVPNQVQGQDRWTLSVWGRDGSVNMQSQAGRPDSVVVPASLLATVLRGPTGRVDATLVAQQSHVWEQPGDLLLHTNFISTLSWVVEVLPAEELR
ncbi:hypothetical protein BH23GEM6_BH23GEM6_11770 [soil metagenome]